MALSFRTFLVPSLLWEAKLVREPYADESAGSGPWVSGRIGAADKVNPIAEASSPLILGLNLAGYEVDAMAVSFADAAGSPLDGQLFLHFGTMGFSELSTSFPDSIGLAWPTRPEGQSDKNASAVLAFRVQPRYRFRPTGFTGRVGSRLSIALPKTAAAVDSGDAGGGWEWTADYGFTDNEWGWLTLGLYSPHPGDLIAASLPPGIVEAFETLLPLLADDLVDALDGAWPDGGPVPAPDDLPGLLSIYHPDGWRFPMGPDPFQQHLHKTIGRKIFDGLGPTGPLDRTEFFTDEQFWVVPRPRSFLSALLKKEKFPASPTVHWHGEAMGRGSALAMVDHLQHTAVETHERAHFGNRPNSEGIKSLTPLSYAAALMHLHMLGLVDVLGSEDLETPPPTPEWIEKDGTGFYEQCDGADPTQHKTTANPGPDEIEFDTDTLQINIAGSLVRGFWQVHDQSTDALRNVDQHDIVAVLSDRNAGTYVGARVAAGGTPPTLATLEAVITTNPVDWSFAADPLVTGIEIIVTHQTVDGDLYTVLEIHDYEVGAILLDTRHFVRVHGRAWVSDDRIQEVQPPGYDLYEEMQRRPLHSAEVEEILAWAPALELDIEGFFLSTEADRTDAAAAGLVNSTFANAVAPYFFNINTVSNQFFAVQRILGTQLAEDTWEYQGKTRPYTEWIMQLCGWNRSVTGTLQGVFGITFTPNPSGPDGDTDSSWVPDGLYRYTWAMEPLKGFGFSTPGIGAIAGSAAWESMRVVAERRDFDLWSDWEVQWFQDYDVAMAAWEPGVGLGTLHFGVWGSGWITWPHFPGDVPHDEEFFDGLFFGTGGSIAITLRPIFTPTVPNPFLEWEWLWNLKGQTLGFEMIMFLEGSWGTPVLPTISPGFGTIAGASIGLAASAKLGIAWQRVQGQDFTQMRSDLEAAIAEMSYEVRIDVPAGTRFFDTGEHELDDDMRAVLREFCAEHLDTLRQVHAGLEVVGHADSQDTAASNVGLSLSRAVSFYQALQDILGPHLFLAEERTFIGGRGEMEHQAQLWLEVAYQQLGGEPHPGSPPIQFPDPSVPDPEYRRVDVVLDGLHVVNIVSALEGAVVAP